MDLFLAELTDKSHQALGQDAVQRRDKVVCLDSHVQESSQHVHHVVGMHGGEDQVAGEGGIDGDLCGLGVADFAHHNLVWVVPQDRPQSAGESQALFLVDWNLGNAANLVLDRILNCDQLVFVSLNLVQGGVQRGGF